MANPKRKIINDPVYGFITISHPLIFSIIGHPFYQRLRRIQQMAMAQLVYPGAVHTRLHHSLGAYHLMCNVVNELRSKEIEITKEEEIAVKAAILLHDIGHGPFSHALEHELVLGVHHEDLSLQIMQLMNNELNGQLSLAIDIFTNQYHKPFLHQLISGQLDVDRMDYLSRDSFFSGVSEGVIGYDRILKMLTVHQGQLMIEEKGIYSVEKFLVARRQMYWQVYLHKTVLSAEKMLVKIIQRVRSIYNEHRDSLTTGSQVDFFLGEFNGPMNTETIKRFCLMDDFDVISAIKKWSTHSDKVLSLLCTRMLNRNIYKTSIQAAPFEPSFVETKKQQVMQQFGVNEEEANFLCFTGIATNTTYQSKEEKINILYKDGTVKDITEVDNSMIQQNLSSQIKKFYICLLT
ncbi:MAG TPA: HD domain-containing protein [Sediminibacterium sp.]|uniref:HD domain-containing protein n=1 Tax=Sediminibacterium sp. TaxID=1917865 RepID=UPI0008B4040B|nr:HD domain-containing protein [Sediminibacterium sp.]MBT9482917.1 HD domain-containing protein [Sediminibacterium sp.]OHC86837.1 MAG: phosphohydrolase [Sphingobacteriia bacterium RIFOXYC2_FULL_35_18]OHC88307.1 MAG: phosphohydrolase [Sphingobacteriia bacterium RIFOXYD2_FULL_35_12]HLD51792.1 HD domain-containing protein [Sediminibacterium sp.]